MFNGLATAAGVFYFAARALADIPADVDDVDAVGHVNLAFVHVVQHLLGAFRPDFVVAAMAEQAHTDDDIAREGQALLRFQELFLETGAAAEGYDGVFADQKKVLFSYAATFNNRPITTSADNTLSVFARRSE